jgi:Ca-activated chloride channel family protein
VDALRYAPSSKPRPKAYELAFVRLRYKQPNGDVSRLLEKPVRADSARTLGSASEQLRLAAAVVAFGQKLKGGTYTGSYGYEDIAALARGARAADEGESVGEFIRLVGLAQGLSTQASSGQTPQAVLE